MKTKNHLRDRLSPQTRAAATMFQLPRNESAWKRAAQKLIDSNIPQLHIVFRHSILVAVQCLGETFCPVEIDNEVYLTNATFEQLDVNRFISAFRHAGTPTGPVTYFLS